MQSRIFLFIILAGLLCPKMAAQEPGADGGKIHYEHPIPFNPRQYVCYRAAEPLNIDGVADEAAWQSAPWSESFMDIEGQLKPEPPLETRMKILWDDQYLYIFGQLEEPHIWATLRQRDTVIFYDDDFEVFIDPDGDSHGYYELEANAYNTLWDLILLRPYRADDEPKVLDEWNVRGIRTAVHVDGTINHASDEDASWSIEWAIPWSALAELAPGGRSPQDGDQWRINFSRVDWTMEVVNGKYRKVRDPESGRPLPENNWVWSPTGRINMHMPEMWGYVQFSDLHPGEGSVSFVKNPDEQIKWALWQMYFQQRTYHEKYGRYSPDLEGFTVPEVNAGECSFEPEIHTTPHMFEIIAPSCNGTGLWSIRQDGKIQLK